MENYTLKSIILNALKWLHSSDDTNYITALRCTT